MLRFAVISDVHITHWQEGLMEFRRALSWHMEHTKPDLIVLAGDIAYMLDSWKDSACHALHPVNYDYILAALRELCPGVPVFFCMGNHEYPQNNTQPEITAEARALWEEKTGQKRFDHRIFGGYHFITAPVQSWALEQSDEVEAYLMTECDRALADTPDKPVFMVTHLSLPHTCLAFRDNCHYFSEAFRAYLAKHPGLVCIYGHHHVPVQDDKNLWQGGFTALNCPVTAVGYIDVYGAEKAEPTFGVSQSYAVCAEGAEVEISRVDHVSGTVYGTPWRFTAGGEELYAPARFTDAPEFAEGTELTAKAVESGVTLTIPQKWAESWNGTVNFFDITCENGSVTETHRIDANHWLVPIPEKVERTVKLSPGPWKISAVPVSSFGHAGKKALTVKVTVTA